MNEEEKSMLASLSPLKRADFFKRLIEEENLTLSKIAKRFNKSLSFVSNTLRLLKLPAIIKEGLLNKDISEGHARALIMVEDHKAVVDLYRKILIEKSSVRQTEKLVRNLKKDN